MCEECLWHSCQQIPVSSECYGTGAFHSGDHRPRLPVHPLPPERSCTRFAECHDENRGRPAQHHPGCMERGGVLDDMQQRLAGNYTTKIAKRQRLYLKQYYSGTAGAVPWQQRMAKAAGQT